MRLIFDLFPCQTDSRLRGIGRYCLSLAKAMAAQRGDHELRLFANGLYPDTTAALRDEFITLVPPGALSAYTHPPLSAAGIDAPADEEVASAVVQVAYQAVHADATLCASPFEGWYERGIAARPDAALPSGLRVALLYDFIPLLFPAQHLEPAPGYAEWYRRRLDALEHVDLFLAISEATRADAIRILGIPPERVVNIAGAADEHFRVELDRTKVADTVYGLGIVRPFVLYTGNGDYRKNLAGMIRAYAALSPALRAAHQLVVSQVGDLQLFREQMRDAGLADDEVVVTGRVDDDVLRALYNACTVFVFPSLYEGFGLPVLEAMQCGAPVIAANNSSIPEVVGRTDALFDASEPGRITASIEKVLSDGAWRADLARHSLARAGAFSWERSARLAWDAIVAARPRHAPVLTPLKVGVVNALTQDASLDTDAVLAALAQHHTLTTLDAATASTTLSGTLQHVDVVMYIANPATLTPSLVRLVRSAPGMLWLRDVASAGASKHPADPALLLRDAGLQGLNAWLSNGSAAAPGRSLFEALSGLALDSATDAASMRQQHGPALPPLSCLDVADGAPDARAGKLAALLMTARARNPRAAAARIARHWGNRSPGAMLETVAAHAQANLMSNRTPRLLIDVTQLASTDALSGIQRVVRNIAREMCLLNDALPPIELVQLKEGELRRANAVAARLFGHPANAVPEGTIDIHPGDVLFMIDSSWQQYPDFDNIFTNVRRLGGRIVTVVYDLIPLRMPQFCVAGLVKMFHHWFKLAVQHSDMLLCISRAVRDDVAAWLDEHAMHPSHPLQLEYWHLGADIVPDDSDQAIRPEVAAMAADTSSPLFLMVGTIEPRKGHDAALNAFDALWSEGSDVRLCLAGKEGWQVEGLMARIRQHPELNRRLFFVERFTDAEINLCYSRAQALLAASVAEGYGLPIVEAAQHRVPVIATDIAVFREVAGAGAAYFPLGDKQALMALIRHFTTLGRVEREAMADLVEVLSWRASARQVWSQLGRYLV